MNINLVDFMEDLEGNKEQINKALAALAGDEAICGGPALIPATDLSEALGVFEVWWPTRETAGHEIYDHWFAHVTPSGSLIRTEILPGAEYFDEKYKGQ